jgi:hypothetical protein
MEDERIKLAVLWLLWLVTDLQTWALMLIEPGLIDEIRTGEVMGVVVGPEMLLLGAVIIFIALVMVYLSLTLNYPVNRRANVILGVVYTFLGITDIIEQAAEPSAHRILMMLAKVVFSALIAWYAWKWSKKEA